MKVTIAKLTAITLLLIIGRYFVTAELLMLYYNTRGYLNTNLFAFIAYFGVVILSLCSIFSSAFLSNRAMRLTCVLWIVLNSALIVIYYEMVGFGAVDAEWAVGIFDVLWTERAMALDAFRIYKSEICVFVLVTLPAAAVLCKEPSPRVRLQGGWNYIPILSMVSIVVLMSYTKGVMERFPTLAALPLRMAMKLSLRPAVFPAPQRPVELTHHRPPFTKVVFIMDESIRGDYTSLGNLQIATTPYLLSYGDLINFGLAISSHNCSTPSRYILRYGIRPEELPVALQLGLNHGGPSIWDYAKVAGFKTIYIDGFRDIFGFHSGMNIPEARNIDQTVKVSIDPTYLRDLHIADRLIGALRDPQPSFIYIDKFGAHPPYDDKYPTERSKLPPFKKNWQDEIMLHYKNSVNWAVDEFFKKVLEQQDNLDTILVIYTSDHGQSLFDGGYKSSHCNMGRYIARGEGIVPLAAITSNEEWRVLLKDSASKGFSKFTHFDIFPTLLLAFGYNKFETQAKYGPSLFDPPSRGQRFLVGMSNSLRWVSAEEGSRDSARPGADYEPEFLCCWR